MSTSNTTRLRIKKIFFALITSATLFTQSTLFPYNKAYAEFSLTVDEYTIPTERSSASELTADTDGNIWFAESSVNRIGKLTKNGLIEEIELSFPSQPYDIVSDSQNNIWFTEISANAIGRISNDGTVDRFVLPNLNSYPYKITYGSDRNIWFTEYWGNRIGRIQPNGEISEFIIPTKDSFPSDITSGTDGNIWFTEENSKKIGRLSANGEITEFTLPSTPTGITPREITSGPDGNLWFTIVNPIQNTFGIGRITPNGIITQFFNLHFQPYGITAGPEGRVWFTEHLGNNLGSITSEGTIIEYSIPHDDYRGIVLDRDKFLWTVETTQNKITRIKVSSVSPSITPTPTPPNTEGILNVPYFSQNVSPWGQSEYDHTKSLGVTGYNTTMDRWGCAVTSVAMILNYHNIKQFADGKAIDPGSLNEWLKNNNGYSYGSNKGGWYSSIRWWEIGTLTAQLYKAGKAPYKLEWKKPIESSDKKAVITQDLTVGNSLAKIPSVLLVKNSQTTGHYVVTKGLLNNTFAINDPEWNYSDLTSFNSTYYDVHRYVPSKTDLSYITAVVNPNIEILVTDSQGRRTGKIVNNGEIEVFDEIPEATYTFEPPIANPNEDESVETVGTGVNQFLLPNPDNGDYQITLSSLDNDTYTLNTSAVEVDGDSVANKSVGVLSPTTQNSFVVSYISTEPSIANKEITFDVLKSDINSLYKQGYIKNKLVYNTLKFQVDLAERASQINRQPLGNNLAIIPLKTFILELNKVRKKTVTEDAYQILYKDVTALIKSLQEGTTPEPTPTPGNGGS